MAPMPKPVSVTIDPESPVQSLIDALGVGAYAAAAARGLHTSYVTSSIRTGARVQLSLLVETARALGVEEIRIPIPKKSGGSS